MISWKHLCYPCLISQWNTLVWDALTNYNCNLCGKIRTSWNTHTPRYCCGACSEENQECMECGSKDIVDGKYSDICNYGFTKGGEKSTIVFYHGNCNDWTGAAYSAQKKLGTDDTAYIPVKYGEYVPIEFLKDKIIYFLDFCFSVESMKRLIETNKEVIVIDHHITAKEALEKWLSKEQYEKCCHFDITHSWAYLAHKYFHPDQKVPKFILHIEDGDLYSFKIKDTRKFYAGFNIYWKTYYDLRLLEESRYLKKLIEKGEILDEYYNKLIEDLSKNNYPITLAGEKWLAVNSTGQFASDIGNQLARLSGTYGAVWSVDAEQIKCSLRSIWNYDVSELAKKFWWGWHKNASAFSIKKNDCLFETMMKDILNFEYYYEKEKEKPK